MDIKISNISKTFGTKTTLLNVYLDLNKNSFIAIVGRSGSGKTTLLSIVNTLLSPTSGQVYYNGKSFKKMTRTEKLKLRQESLSVILQRPYYLRNLSVQDNILLPAVLKKIPFHSIKKGYQNYIELFGLKKKIHKKPFQLSGGEIQKMIIIRAILENKEILIADEPTGDLDSESTQLIIDIFLNLNKQGRTILMTTHNERFIQSLKNIYLLENGKLRI